MRSSQWSAEMFVSTLYLLASLLILDFHTALPTGGY
jgi:hypothetical protein